MVGAATPRASRAVWGAGAPPSPAGRLAAGLGPSQSPPLLCGAGGAHTLSLISPVKCPYLPSGTLCPSDPVLWTAPSRASCPLSPSFLPRTPELPGLGWPRPRGAGRGRCCGHLACWDLACCPCPAAWVGVLVPLHCTPSGIHLLTPCHLCHGVGSSLPATQQWGQGRAGLRETPTRAQGLPGLAGHLQDSWAWGARGDARPGPGFPPGRCFVAGAICQ